MYHKILLAVAPDHPETVGDLVQAARALAAPDAAIEALSIVLAVPTYIELEIPKSIYEKSMKEVRARLDADLAAIEADDIRRVIRIGNPWREIEAYQAEGGHDLIVLRSHRPGMQDFFMGSTAGRVVRHAPCSVHVIRS